MSEPAVFTFVSSHQPECLFSIKADKSVEFNWNAIHQEAHRAPKDSTDMNPGWCYALLYATWRLQSLIEPLKDPNGHPTKHR